MFTLNNGCYTGILRALLEKGAEVNAVDIYGWGFKK
jgi:hypothetical protein